MIAMTLLVLFAMYHRTGGPGYIAVFGVAAFYQVFLLIRYVEKTQRDLTQFLDAVNYEDFSQTFRSPGSGRIQQDLHNAFNKVLQKFIDTRAETEMQYRYLQTVVQHIGIGLIAFRADGGVHMINNAAKKLLKVVTLRSVSDLDSVAPGLAATFLSLRTGQNRLIKIQQPESILQVMVHTTEFILGSEQYTLVSLQNIQSELEEKEMEAWQNLIKVLTHEIMNSITPISSLASTAENLIKKKCDGAQIPPEVKDDIHQALRIIEKRSSGLLHFVESYRRLTRLPAPDFQILPVSDLFSRIEQLLRQSLENMGIVFSIDIDPRSLELTADPNMVEQVLINLINNAEHALAGRPAPRIRLSARIGSGGRPCIYVEDNGRGILEEVQNNIFIPFFTTKKEGTGIGLSLARQIMRMHGGSIRVSSIPDQKTTFILQF